VAVAVAVALAVAVAVAVAVVSVAVAVAVAVALAVSLAVAVAVAVALSQTPKQARGGGVGAEEWILLERVLVKDQRVVAALSVARVPAEAAVEAVGEGRRQRRRRTTCLSQVRRVRTRRPLRPEAQTIGHLRGKTKTTKVTRNRQTTSKCLGYKTLGTRVS
jgi:hypothetical protein